MLCRDPVSMADDIGLGELAGLSSTEQVLQDPNLLRYIAIYLTPRGRLTFSTLSRACAASVKVPEFWETISGTVIERTGAVKKVSWSYSEAAQYGNRLGCILRQYGRFCTLLHLANCAWLQVTGLEDLARCSNLVHLDMSGCRHYSVDLLGHVVRHCSSLRSLMARNCVRICEPEVIQGLYDLPEGLQLNLEHLDLQGVPFTQDAVIEGPHPGNDLARALQRLTVNRLVSLRLGWLGEASDTDIVRSNLDDVMDQVRASAGTLRLLDLAGFWSGNSFGSAGERCLHSLSALRVLCLSNCREPDLGIGLQRCPTTQLVYLNLRGLSALEDANLAPLLAANPGLRSLNVGCCALLSDATLQAVARHCRGLTSLDVCYARGMTAQGVRAVLKYLPLLNEFGCSGFVGLMDVDISNLVTRLPGLRMIGIGGLSFLTDASLHSIAAGCPFLESLYACDLPNVTHAGLEALLRGCTRLHRVAMSNCGRLPPADVAMLRSKYSYVFKGDMLPDNVARAENEFLAAVG